MDPIANIKEQRELAGDLLTVAQGFHENHLVFSGDNAEKVCRLAELVEALDDWRKDGGFDPYKAA